MLNGIIVIALHIELEKQYIVSNPQKRRTCFNEAKRVC